MTNTDESTQSEQSAFIVTEPDTPEAVFRVTNAANFCYKKLLSTDTNNADELRSLKSRSLREKKNSSRAWKALSGQFESAKGQGWAALLHEAEQLLQDVADTCESHLMGLESGLSDEDLQALENALDAVLADAAAKKNAASVSVN